jgi:hypothetical protein
MPLAQNPAGFSRLRAKRTEITGNSGNFLNFKKILKLPLPSPSLSMSHNSDSHAEIALFPNDCVNFRGGAGRAVIHRENVRDNIIPALPGQREFLDRMLTGSQAKTAYALRLNAETMICGDSPRKLVTFDYPDGRKIKAWIAEKPDNLNCTGFLTLTIGARDETGRFRGVADASEASRRLNNLNRRVLELLFERAILVTERHQSGDIHFHMLGVLRSHADIRTGFNFDTFENLRTRGTKFSAADVGASPELAAIWKMLRETLPGYGFGRAQLTPIKKTSEAVAAYISKYIEKNVCNRLPQDAHKKLVRYIGWEKTQLKPNEFAWGTARAAAWRGKTRECAGLLGMESPDQCARAFGPRWAWRISGIWTKIDDAVHPFMIWPNFATREVARRELFRDAHQDYLRRINLPIEHPVKIGQEKWSKDECAYFLAAAKN